MAVFEGAGVALITPFKENGEVNYEKLEELVEEQIAGGTDAIIACGTTGEASTMSHEEHLDVIRFVCEKVKGRLPVVAGTGSNCTETAVYLSEEAEKLGADAVLQVSPYYNKATQKGLYKHFAAVAEAIRIPVILYNIPGRTGVNIAAGTIADLCKNVDNIVGVKEASGDFALIQKTRELCPEDFYIWSGNDDETAPIMLLGGVGVISVAANIVPDAMARMTHACLKGDFVTAGRMQLRLRKLCEALFCEVNPIPVKAALAMMGRCREVLRQPLCEMEEGDRERLRKVLEEYGLV